MTPSPAGATTTGRATRRTVRRRLHRRVPFVRAAHQQHHHLLGQQQHRAERRAGRTIRRRFRRRFAFVRAAHQQHRHLLGRLRRGTTRRCAVPTFLTLLRARWARIAAPAHCGCLAGTSGRSAPAYPLGNTPSDLTPDTAAVLGRLSPSQPQRGSRPGASTVTRITRLRAFPTASEPRSQSGTVSEHSSGGNLAADPDPAQNPRAAVRVAAVPPRSRGCRASWFSFLRGARLMGPLPTSDLPVRHPIGGPQQRPSLTHPPIRQRPRTRHHPQLPTLLNRPLQRGRNHNSQCPIPTHTTIYQTDHKCSDTRGPHVGCPSG